MNRRLVIVGGSDAGISAGLYAKELDQWCEVTIVVADHFPNYSICGLQFYLSNEVPDWRALAHRTIEELVFLSCLTIQLKTLLQPTIVFPSLMKVGTQDIFITID
jgi:hypothetical protein